MKKNSLRAFSLFIALAFVSACAGIKQETFVLSGGKTIDYIHGKVDADGQTGVFRDAYLDGAPVLTHFGHGQSLLGQVLQGTASSAMIAGGMVGAAAVLRPTRINESNDFNNSQGQAQSQEQGAYSGSHSESNPILVNKNKSSSSSEANPILVNSNSNHNSSKNTNISGSYASGGNVKIGDIGGGDGGNPGCAKAKNGC